MRIKKISVGKRRVELRGKAISDPAYLAVFRKSLKFAEKFIIEKYGRDGRLACGRTSYIIHPAFRSSYHYGGYNLIKMSCIMAQRKFSFSNRRRITEITPISSIDSLTRHCYYERKTVGLRAPDDFCLPFDVRYTSVLIHELTHAVQNYQGRAASEVETTQNELEFLACHHNEYYKKLIKI